MCDTLIIQSYRPSLPYQWIEYCLKSVRDWCKTNNYEYRFIGDELFNAIPENIRNKTQNQKVIATDLARLLILKEALAENYQTAIWLDADFLIFNPINFVIPDWSYAVGREVWIQHDKNSKLKAYKKVHNAFLMFRQDNPFLEFYANTAERLLLQNKGTIPPQFIGPKLLTALHNIALLPVIETAGMLSPMVIKDIVKGKGPALDLFIQHSPQPVTAANLCISSCNRNDVTDMEMETLIDCLCNEAKPIGIELKNYNYSR